MSGLSHSSGVYLHDIYDLGREQALAAQENGCLQNPKSLCSLKWWLQQSSGLAEEGLTSMETAGVFYGLGNNCLKQGR